MDTQNIVDSSAATDYPFSHGCIDANLHYLTLTKGPGRSSDAAGPFTVRPGRRHARTGARRHGPGHGLRNLRIAVRESLFGGCCRQAKLKGGIRRFDAKSLHVLRRATLTPPEPFHPKAFRFTQLRLPEPFVVGAPPSPKTLRREHSSRSEDPSLRALRQIRRPFVALAPPGPMTLCCAK